MDRVPVATAVQPRGSTRLRARRALRFATWAGLGVAGCAQGRAPGAPFNPDAATGSDASRGRDDAGPDAALRGTVCTNTTTGAMPTIDGNNDLAEYPAAQQVPLFASLGTSDGAAVTWDDKNLYLTVASPAFANAYEPLHVYIDASTTPLAPAVASQGKEYSGLVAALPFSPNYLLAARRVSDAGTGPYNGIYVPGSGWSVQPTPLEDLVNVFVSADHQQLSLKVPWLAIGGCPGSLRLAMHIVHAQPANEWKDVAPVDGTPWQAPGGGYYDIDLTGATAVAGWMQH
jgi:hypothetical protein